MRIEHLIFLIHPGVYESVSADLVQRDNLGLYVRREREVRQKWLDALRRLDSSTLFLEHCGPLYLLEAAKESLGEANACYVYADPPADGRRQTRMRMMVQGIRDHMEKFDLEFDPATATSEVWGETFQGCACGYSGAFAQELGLKKPPKMRFEMTVYDTRFLYGARRWETIPLSGTDIEAWIFECRDTTSAATFQARLTDRCFDERAIRLELDATSMQVCLAGPGLSIWPEYRPGAKGPEDNVRTFIMPMGDSAYWVRAIGTSYENLKEVVRAAVVVEGPAAERDRTGQKERR